MRRNRCNNSRTRRRRRSSTAARATALLSSGTASVLQVLLLLFLVILAVAVAASGSSSSSIQHNAEEDLLHQPDGAEEANDKDSFVSSQRDDEERGQDARIAMNTSPSSAQQNRHLLSSLIDNPQVKERYLADPPGYRKHPSYYSETYLRRAAARVDDDITKEAEKKTWGSWTLVDDKRTIRPGDEFYAKYTNRDVPLADFPKDAWQKNSDYVEKFLNQATDLTMRAMEAILAEYGNGPYSDTAAAADFAQRSAAFQVDKLGNDLVIASSKDANTKGGWMPQQSWNGLKRRLLHAIITEDSFNLVMGGHSSAAGHGNHFQQSYTLQYGRIMEPIFARLGVKGTASNMGMGGMGTMHNSIGAGSIYGRDVDILLWDSGMTEPALVDQGIFATQGLLGSDRAPLLWFDRNSCLITLHQDTNADIGVYGNGRAILKEAETFDALAQQTWAARYMSCNSEIAGECKAQSHQYNGTCWIDRTGGKWKDSIELQDYTPTTQQNPEPGGRASWHPGNHVHQLQGRTLAFVVLLALHEALMDWKQATNYELPDEAWHVTAYYKNIHDKVAASSMTDAWCQEKKLSMAICRVAMSARSENTPRARPWETNIRSLIKASGNFPVSVPNAYDPPDVYNPKLDPPPGEIDVLAIVENGVDFAPNLARIRDSQEKMNFQQPLSSSSGKTMNPAIVPGKGWYLGSVGSDNCDGMYDSHCNRGDSNNCLLYAHNDGRNSIMFDSLSGWMVFNIPKIEHGVLILGIYDWLVDNPATRGWCSENNEEPCNSRNLRAPRGDNATDHHAASNSKLEEFTEESSLPPRHLKKSSVIPYCGDFKFEYAINGQIETLDLQTWSDMQNHVERVVQLWTIKDDPSFTGENIEFAIRMIGCVKPPRKTFGLSHIYWA